FAQAKPLVINTASPPRLAMLMELVTKEALRSLGYELRVNRQAGERALQNANAGIEDGDGVRIAGLSSQYPNLIQVPEAYYDVEMSAFARDPAIRISGWKDLEKWRVGYLLGWKLYEENVKAAEISRVKETEALFRMLGFGRIDIALLQKLDGVAMARKLGLDEIRPLDPPLEVMPHYLYLNVRHRDLVPLLSAEIHRMKRDGRYAAIVERVLNEP
ncbi:MAG: transporter substrate-binding domain-containing protein, partial [Spirochaetaceae bacterium]|nr:transporter substrate-binding domain-containing protein [Spirochaetaceae bacterium]